MDNLLRKMKERNFLIFSAVTCFLGDLLIALYVRHIFLDFSLFKKLFEQAAGIQGLDITSIDPSFIEGQFYILKNSITMLIALLLAVHLVVYILYFFKKSSAARYISATLWLSIPTNLIFIYEAYSISKIFALLFLLQTPLYIFSYKGIKLFKLNTKMLEHKNSLSPLPSSQEE